MLLPAVLMLVTVLVTGCDRFKKPAPVEFKTCLLYTSDAADE